MGQNITRRVRFMYISWLIDFWFLIRREISTNYTKNLNYEHALETVVWEKALILPRQTNLT